MSKFRVILELLRKQYGAPATPPAKGPLELVFWENACYLLPDSRRAAVFEALKTQVGLTPQAILDATDEVLLPLAKMGGMRPETRVFRWRQIAFTVVQEFGGDLDSILQRPYPEAAKALHKFPNIGQPGAEKILLLCGLANGLPLESNGLRVLEKLGWGRAQKSYGAVYRSVQADIRRELPSDPALLLEAHLLLREHGKTLCKASAPLCQQCPAAKLCNYAVASRLT
jgi:endonuclease-3